MPALNRLFKPCLAALLCSQLPLANAESAHPISAANFSSATQKQVFEHWKPYRFGLFTRETRYHLIRDEGKQVLQATSDDSASGLIRRLPIQLSDYPILTWRWKTDALPRNADDRSKEGDDHSTRLYLIFNAPESGLLNWIASATGWGNTHALNYIWANESPVDTFLPSPYTARSVMIAASSGTQRVGEWIEISRNVYQDYLKAFGTAPPPLAAIALMSDSDNTDSKLVSYYSDIHFYSLDNGRID